MPAAVPVLVFLLVWGIFQSVQKNWRVAFLSACAACCTLLVAITELLSLFQAITFVNILGAWCVALAAAVVGWARTVAHPRHVFSGLAAARLSREEYALLGGGALIASTVGVIAWIAPPNTIDALTYHMPRVMHWIQNRNVAFYPTPILRQLYVNPGSEYIILHLQSLTGSDRLANFVQWSCMLGSAVGISLVSAELGATKRGQVFSALLSLCIPMGVLQGSSTQTDYVTSFWLVNFIYWALLLRRRHHYAEAAACGTSLGLAVLTKSTSYILALPFCLGLGISLLKAPWRRAAGLAVCLSCIFVLLNLGVYIRSSQLFGNPLAISTSIPERYLNEIFSLPEWVSNVVRNIVLNLTTPFAGINSSVASATHFLHNVIGISENDRRTTWQGTTFGVLPIQFSENRDGNLLHFILITVTILLIWFRRKRVVGLLPYSAGLVCAFLIFCLLIKWQPWSTRLQLPLFVLSSAVLGRTVDEFYPRRVGRAIMVAMLLGALPWVLLNSSRPLLGRHSIVFGDRTSLYFRTNAVSQENPYVASTRYVGTRSVYACTDVGIDIPNDTPEYLFWMLLQRRARADVHVYGVNVHNVSSAAHAGVTNRVLCAILSISNPPRRSLLVQGTTYVAVKDFKQITVLVPRE